MAASGLRNSWATSDENDSTKARCRSARRRQLLEGPGEVADLVPPPRAAEGAAQPAARVEEAAGFVTETDERPGDRGRDEEAEGRGGEDRDDEDAKDVEADRPEGREDAGRGARDDDRADDVASGRPDGDDAVERERALARALAERRPVETLEGAADLVARERVEDRCGAFVRRPVEERANEAHRLPESGADR